MNERLLVVDDERSMREFLEIMLAGEGYQVNTAASGEDAYDIYRKDRPDLVLTDVRMPGMSGLDLIKEIRAIDPFAPIIAITAYASAGDAIRAVREGAYDYISKPFQVEDLRAVIRNALEARRLRAETLRAAESQSAGRGLGGLVGTSPEMIEIFDLVAKVAPSRASVLIVGESGTGKELVAKAIHQLSPRENRPFVILNCTAIPEPLLESELFGHARGSFTGAVAAKPGLVEAAHTGTLFLDEVGELPLAIQAKLLRFLQELEFRRVGENEDRKVDVRVVAATNRDLEADMARGGFREDLYYRLNVIRIKIPPLRERDSDIPLLVRHFLGRYAEEQGKKIDKVSSLAMRVLRSYDYPGNVRELENIVERCVTLERSDQLTAEHLPSKLVQQPRPTGIWNDLDIPPQGINIDEVTEELERKLIRRALDIADGSRSRAAGLLGITQRTLRHRLMKLGMDVKDNRT